MKNVVTKPTLDSAQSQRELLAKRLRAVADRTRHSPLSFAQQRLWFLDQLQPDSPLYNIASVARLEGDLDIAILEEALKKVVARHEALRTRFVCRDGVPYQVIDGLAQVRLRRIDLSERPQAQGEAEAQALVQDEVHRPFHLGSEPLLRATLLRFGPGEYQLVLILHHIVADEWSLRVLYRELAAFYTAKIERKPVLLPELSIQYSDYAQWQRDWLQGDVLEKQLAYWREQLNGDLPLTELATDHVRKPMPSFRGGNAELTLGPELHKGLSLLAEEGGATLFMLLLAGFKALLYRYTHQEDLIICSPTAGRTRVETEPLIGFFVNTLPFRTSLSGNPTFSELLARVRQVTLGAYAHQDVPFEKLVEELRPERSLSHLPFTRLMFTLRNSPLEELKLPGVSLRFLKVQSEMAKFDLTLSLQETSQGLMANAEYCADLFEAATMKRLLKHFSVLLYGALRAPNLPVSELPLLTEDEREEIVVDWNRTSTDCPRDKCIHEVFESKVEQTPDAAAAVFGQQLLSYRELNARANQLARYLKRFNVGPDVPVGLCMNRSSDMVVAMLAVLKAGGAYLPLDPSYPQERLAFMLEDTQAPVLLTQQSLITCVSTKLTKLVCLDTDWELVARESPQNLPCVSSPESLAYIIYTSGSTGQPKGVAVPHRAINRLVLNTDYIQISRHDRIAQASNASFDAATFEVWGALLNGAQVVGISPSVMLSPADLAHALRSEKISILFLTTALFNELAAQTPDAFATLRTVLFGGESVDPKWVRAVLAHPPERLVHVYGPTENTTFSTWHRVEEVPANATTIPIGLPIANTQCYVLDQRRQPVPIGVAGELFVGGDGLARGYWNRPALTAEKFIQNPFDPAGPSFLYRTGDIVRWLPDGTIEFLERGDDQVKVRGFRVELGEIEAVLSLHPAVQKCVVLASGESGGSRRLVAYVVGSGEASTNSSELRSFLSETLPDYMVPSLFVLLRAFPLTPNGKIDRKALPPPDQVRPDLEKQYAAPRDEIERRLVGIWEKVLGVSPIGVQDKFFDLGGHSLLAVRVIAQIEKVLGRKLRLATLFQALTIERLASILRDEITENGVGCGTSVVEIQPHGSAPPLYLVHGAGGGMFWGYINLSRSLGLDQPVYAFKSRGLDGREEFSRIEDIAAQYVADLKSRQPHGPYYLGGYCFGGNVAFEMARQLSAQKQTVGLLALMNCAPPNSRYGRISWTPRWTARFATNLLYWAKYFREWNPRQRRDFFRWKASLLKRRLAGWFRKPAESGTPADVRNLVDLSAYTEEQRTIWEAHIRGLVNFHPQSYSGHVHLFRSPGHPFWCSFEPDYGWGELAKGGVTTEIVPGAHEKLLEEPCVRIVAAKLHRALAEARLVARPTFVGLKGTNSSSPAPGTQPLSGFKELERSASAVETFLQAFATQVQRTPSGIAVSFQQEDLTYAQLEARSNRLAWHLQKLGIGPEVLVAVCLERSVEQLVSLLAILKAGGAYLPLDPAYPPERLAYMLKDSRARLVVTQSKLLPRLEGSSAQVVCIDEAQHRQLIDRSFATTPGNQATVDHLAYVIYTSGSTGEPKGVEITHRALLSHNRAVISAYGLNSTDRVLQFTSLSFDISVEEIFPTWLSGGTVVVRPEQAISSMARFCDFLAEERVTVLNLPTAYWYELTEFLDTSSVGFPDSIRTVIIGGEKAANEVFRRWKKRVGSSVVLINSYGVTEATVTTTVYTARPEDDALCIGRPLSNSEMLILDEGLQPVPSGSPGELFIGGEAVARGYLNRPELTAQRFIPNPLGSTLRASRFYRTGDTVRTLPDGNLEFLGRSDDQVKVRGYRIELGEIETVLRGHPNLKDVAVSAREDQQGKRRLVAYVVLRKASGPCIGELVSFLKTKVPAYMIPSAFVPLPELPLTPAGKVDRRSLPSPENSRPALDQEFVAPQTPLEQTLAQIWAELLELQPIGIHDNFFELGGHSLVAIQAISRLRDALQMEITLADFFARPTINGLAAFLLELTTSVPVRSPAARSESDQWRPLAPNQRRVWFLDQFEPGCSPYVRTIAVRLNGSLNLRALEQSLTRLSCWQEALRIVLQSEDGEPAQSIAEADKIKLHSFDLTQVPRHERENAVLQFLDQDSHRSQSVSEQVFRPFLFRLGQREHWLVLVLHEIAFDSFSVRLLLRELPKVYHALAEHSHYALPPVAISYVDAIYQAEQLTAEEQERHFTFWKHRLAGAPELLDLPADRARLAQGSVAGARYPVIVAEDFSRLTGSNTAGERHLFITLLASWAALLHRYTGSTDLVIGSLASNRRLKWKGLAANLENPVALRCDLTEDPTFRQLRNRIADTTQEAFEHGALPFANLVEQLHPGRNASYSPVFQTMLIVEEDRLPLSSSAGVAFTPFELDRQTSKFDLALRLTNGPGGVEGWLEYSTALFDESRIARMAGHFTTLLHAALSTPDERISSLPLMPEAERKLLLSEWPNTHKPYDGHKDLVELFEEQVLRTPHAEALVSGTTRLTYCELSLRAREIAGQLSRLGAGTESLVGICLERSADMVAAILGTLMSGAAYVPLDPAYPAERIAFIMQDAQLRVVLTQSRLMQSLPKTGATLVCVDALESGPDPEEVSPQRKLRTGSPSALAYVIYTSGSTGKPKGVALEHKGAVALVSWARDIFTAEALSGVLASTSICFDLSVFELFVPLSWGGKVILAENALALPTLPAAQEVSLVNTVPSAVRELLRMKGIPSSVQVINLAGEPLTPDLVNQLYNETAARKVYDLYGPTETTTYSTFTLREAGKPATIGRPLANEQVYLFDAHRQLVPIGVPGELYIGGDGLARGYLNRPELTAEKFVPHPFEAGARLYRTGDLARWRVDGNLEYLGRIDHQVKIRGFRIELGEIESVLKTHAAVRESVVLAREDHPGDKRLVAYLVPEPSSEVNIDQLRALVREKLPEYMMPSAFVVLEALPMTPNGKVDRKALPKPEEKGGGSGKKSTAPRNALETQIAAVWCEVLHVEQIGIEDNFFDLGGHSLMAIRALSRIREIFKVELPMSSLFTAPTIESFCEGLASGQWTKDKTPMLPLEPAPRQGKLPVSFVQERLWFLDQLEPGGCAYNVPVALRLQGKLDTDALQSALDEVVSRHESLRSTFNYSEGILEQVIHPTSRIEMRVTDLQELPQDQIKAHVEELATQEAQGAFDLARGPLLRVHLVRLSPAEYILVVVMHHTICDGWSLALFFQELAVLYDGFIGAKSVSKLSDPGLQYVDFAHWQREWMQGPVLAHELAYWKGALEGAPDNLGLPTDAALPSQPTDRAARCAIVLDEKLERALGELGRTEGCTLFIVLMTALHLTLYKWTQAQDLVIGTVMAGRTRREVENMIGCFMNFLPIRAKLSATETGRNILARVRTSVLDAQTHQDCPFEKIVEALKPQRRLHQNPLYNVALLVQNFPSDLFQSRQIATTVMPVSTQAALLDLRFDAENTPQGLALTCEYKTELFQDETIQELLASYLQILELLVNQPTAGLSEFKITPALEQQARSARAREQKLKLAVTATFTCEPVAESLEYWMRQLELPSAIQFAPYNQVFQQLLDPTSLLRTNQLGLNMVVVRFEDWARSGAAPDRSGSSDEHIERTAGEFINVVKSAATQSPSPFLICVCPPSPFFAAGSGRGEFLCRVEESLRVALEGVGGVYLLTSAELERWYHVADSYDARSDELGHVPYTPVFFTALGTAIARKVYTLNRPAHKVIVLDCDQTLWSGVCGEDGAKGIKLDPPRLALQRFMRAQQESGMLLCVCSKNNEQDVLEVFSQRLDMPLRHEHFSGFRLNWLPKSENLKSLAAELGLGLNSFIFLDDNPVECAEVEANCPEVLTLQLPENPALIGPFLDHCWVFDHLKVTEEDRRRSELYRQNQQRETLRQHTPSLAEFLAGLELHVSIEPITAAQRPRVAQLTQRTNQFNLTTQRLTENQLQQTLTRCRGLSVQVRDRFGDYGLVGVILYEAGTESLKIDSFLLSCRVLGRGVEHQMLARLGELARHQGAAWVDVHFAPTEKNKPGLDFLESVGSAFKQPLNGGYVFRFPVGFASEITFQPPIVEDRPEVLERVPTARIEAGNEAARKFNACRRIALEACDPALIHQVLQTSLGQRQADHLNYTAPQTEIERRLCEIWANLLHVEQVGLHDNFFTLGGHSLLAVRLFAEIEKFTGRKYPLITLFGAPTVSELAKVLSRDDSPGAPTLLVPIQPKGSRPPLFLIHGAGGDVLWGYANLAQHLPPDQPLYGIKSRGQIGLEEFTRLEEMARCYLEAVRQHQPNGPYYLGGYCFGGNVAYEMARQLRAQGQQVALVALLDSAPANTGYERVPWWRPSFPWRFMRNLINWLQDFANLPARDRRNFFLRKARGFGRKILRRLSLERGPAPVDLEEVIDPSRIPDHELKLWQIHLQALTDHTEQPYPGAVVLLRTRGQALLCSLEEDFCWRKVVQGGVKVVFVPGSHESVFLEPNVQSLAHELSALLAEAQTQVAARPFPKHSTNEARLSIQ